MHTDYCVVPITLLRMSSSSSTSSNWSSMSSSSSLPNINLHIQLHEIEGTHDFCGYVFASRVPDLDNTHNEHTFSCDVGTSNTEGLCGMLWKK